MLVYILVGILLTVIVYMLWSIVARQKQLRREDRYYTENIMPVFEYPPYNGWWWPGTSVIYGTGGWWRPPFWRGVDGDWGSGWQPGQVSPRWRGGGFHYRPPPMPGKGDASGGLPGMGRIPKPTPTVSVPSGGGGGIPKPAPTVSVSSTSGGMPGGGK